MNSKSIFRRYAMMTLLSLLFFGPLIAAWTYFFYGDKQSFTTINKGTLIQPAIHLNDVDIAQLNGDHINSDSDLINRKWVLLLYYPNCDATSCLDNIHKIRQVRLSLAQEMDRVERVLASQSRISADLTEKINQDYAGTLVTQLNTKPGGEYAWQEGIYIVDPRGFIMMHYAPDAEPGDIYSDLTHLMKYSHIG